MCEKTAIVYILKRKIPLVRIDIHYHSRIYVYDHVKCVPYEIILWKWLTSAHGCLHYTYAGAWLLRVIDSYRVSADSRSI